MYKIGVKYQYASRALICLDLFLTDVNIHVLGPIWIILVFVSTTLMKVA